MSAPLRRSVKMSRDQPCMIRKFLKSSSASQRVSRWMAPPCQSNNQGASMIKRSTRKVYQRKPYGFEPFAHPTLPQNQTLHSRVKLPPAKQGAYHFWVTTLLNLFLHDIGLFFILFNRTDILMKSGLFLYRNLLDSGDLKQCRRHI